MKRLLGFMVKTDGWRGRQMGRNREQSRAAFDWGGAFGAAN